MADPEDQRVSLTRKVTRPDAWDTLHGYLELTVSRPVAQEDARDQLRGDVELLTEIACAHHALIVDLIDRVAELKAQPGMEPEAGQGG